jgi:type IV pilus assembly protein PilP
MKLLLPMLLTVAVAMPTAANAQTPAAPPTATTATAAPATPSNVPSPPANYVYSPDGRRDPFVSLVNRGIEKPTKPVAKERPDGIGGVSVDDVVVRGLVESRGGWLAMVGVPNGKTYSIRPGDRLFDGSVRTITPDAVVLMQDVTDPKSVERQREVRKPLRGDAK